MSRSMPMSRTRTIALTLVISVAAVALVAACGDDDDDAAVSLTLSGDECTYEGPTQFEEGPLVAVVKNRNDADAQFRAFAFYSEDDLDRFAQEIDEKRALIADEGEVIVVLSSVPGVWARVTVDPGESEESRFHLLRGHYALLCSNFVGERPFGPKRNKITIMAAPTFLEVTE